jgi:phthalate 4,5-cis-dihydrodiol dehydrogenase
LREELDENRGAGFILRQAPHLVDIACYIAGARAMGVRAMAGRWDANMPTEGNCAALIGFDSGAVANLTLNGYGYFQTSELTWDIGIFGERKPPAKPAIRQNLLEPGEKYRESMTREAKPGGAMPFVGLTIVSCENGVMRQSPGGLYLHTDEGREEIAIPGNPGRAAEFLELRDALAESRDVFPNGEWGKANLEICLAIVQSARESRDILLSAPVNPHPSAGNNSAIP